MNYPVNLKYPKSEYIKLIQVLTVMDEYFDIESIHPCQLHYKAYQQLSEKQPHNHLYKNGNVIKMSHQINDTDGWKKLIDFNFNLELYPTGCHDTHIETATKRAIKEVLNNK